MSGIDPLRVQYHKDQATKLGGMNALVRAFEVTGLDLSEAAPEDPSNGGVLNGAAEAALTRHQLIVGGNTNIQMTNSVGSDGGANSPRAEEEKKSADAIRNQLLQQLQDAANAYFEQAAHHYAEAERYRKLAEEAMQKIEELQEKKGAIDDALDDDKFDREKAIAALEGAGVKVPEGASEEEIRKLLLLQQKKLQDEIDDLSVKFDDYTTKADDHKKIGDDLTRRGNDLLTRMKEIENDRSMSAEEAEAEAERVQQEMQKLLKHEHADQIADRTAEAMKQRIDDQEDRLTVAVQTAQVAAVIKTDGPGF